MTSGNNANMDDQNNTNNNVAAPVVTTNVMSSPINNVQHKQSNNLVFL